ncbi:hypothetical protein JTE90_028281 [Oedothorax gibbosus]|uniref:Transmembrane protein n=1 Tax=Oedothorax gibbosus TaxID=931172 RepID=A0AAV6UD23_9ARAC|nr:hypothetical protein JTE90_028281 [Oedothorax gibbosus]
MSLCRFFPLSKYHQAFRRKWVTRTPFSRLSVHWHTDPCHRGKRNRTDSMDRWSFDHGGHLTFPISSPKTTTMTDQRNSLQEDLFPASITHTPDDNNEDNEQFRMRLTFGLGISEVFCGLMLGIFGLLSMNMEAAMSSLAGGVWAGGVAIATGLSAVCLTKCSSRRAIHAVLFLCLSVASVLTGGLATVFVATGLAHDAQWPAGYYVDSDGRRVLFAGDIATRAPLLAVAAVTLTAAVADCALAVACCIVAAQEACQCYVCSDDDDPIDHDSKVRHDRLVTWLGQQALMDFVMASGKLPDNFSSANVMNNNPPTISALMQNNKRQGPT